MSIPCSFENLPKVIDSLNNELLTAKLYPYGLDILSQQLIFT